MLVSGSYLNFMPSQSFIDFFKPELIFWRILYNWHRFRCNRNSCGAEQSSLCRLDISNLRLFAKYHFLKCRRFQLTLHFDELSCPECIIDLQILIQCWWRHFDVFQAVDVDDDVVLVDAVVVVVVVWQMAWIQVVQNKKIPFELKNQSLCRRNKTNFLDLMNWLESFGWSHFFLWL